MFLPYSWLHFGFNQKCAVVFFSPWHQWVQWWSVFQATLSSFKWALWRQRHATLWRFTLWETWPRAQPPQLNSPLVSLPKSSVFYFGYCSFKLHTKEFECNNAYIHLYICISKCSYMKHTWKCVEPRREGIDNVHGVFLLDVDAPYDLAASNILIESGLLTWKPPRADITGYILSFESTDGTVRVSARESIVESGLSAQRGPRVWLCPQNQVWQWFPHEFSPRRWCWVLPLSPTTWLNSVPPRNIQWNCRPLPAQREAGSSQLHSRPVSRLLSVIQ